MITFTRRAFMATVAATPAFAASPLPAMKISKDPTCGCCTGWAEHIRAAGFPVQVAETSAINRVKAQLGVPSALYACHTAEVGGYVIEGHVPAAAIKRLLAERPTVKGLAVPGMPAGSPGMETDDPAEPFDVIAFGATGQSRFARFKGANPI